MSVTSNKPFERLGSAAGSVPDVVEKGNGVPSKQLKRATPAFADEGGGLRHGRVYQI